jgi:hypothetical protein
MKRYWKLKFLPMAGAGLLLLTFASCATQEKRSDSAENQQPDAQAEVGAKVVGYDEEACYPTLGPCYGYHPTCWHAWPECCTQCPPPPQIIVPVPEEHAPATMVAPEQETAPLMPTPERVPNPPRPNEPVPNESQPLPPSTLQPAAPFPVPPTAPVPPQSTPAPKAVPAAPAPPRAATGSDMQPNDDPSASIAAPMESKEGATDSSAMPIQNPNIAYGNASRTATKPPHWNGDDQDVPPLPPALDYLSQSKLQLHRSTSQQ